MSERDGIVDFHTHFAPPSLATFAANDSALTTLVIESADSCRLICGKRTRNVDERIWSRDRRIADMDARGVALQVLSPVPMMFAYEVPIEPARAYLRLVNHGIAEAVRARPDRFAGLAGVPLQDVDAACDELHYAMNDLGFAGVEIGTNVEGVDLDDERYAPFWSLCADLGAVVFIHPERAPAFSRLRANRLLASAGYPSETGLAAAKLLAGGFLHRYPALQIVLAHGGGTLPWLLPRLDVVWARNPDMHAAAPEAPSTYARRFTLDTLVFDTANLAYLIARVGVAQVVVGTDYPFTLGEEQPGALLAATPGFDTASRTAMQSGNARRLLAATRVS